MCKYKNSFIFAETSQPWKPQIFSQHIPRLSGTEHLHKEGSYRF